MSTIAATERPEEIRDLVGRLEEEHRKFGSDLVGLERGQMVADALKKLFVPLQDALIGHMLTEEFEVYPELMRRDIFDQSVSSIMQQHHEVTSFLGKMELSLRLENFSEFEAALEGLSRVLQKHQPAEENRVFPLATS